MRLRALLSTICTGFKSAHEYEGKTLSDCTYSRVRAGPRARALLVRLTVIDVVRGERIKFVSGAALLRLELRAHDKLVGVQRRLKK